MFRLQLINSEATLKEWIISSPCAADDFGHKTSATTAKCLKRESGRQQHSNQIAPLHCKCNWIMKNSSSNYLYNNLAHGNQKLETVEEQLKSVPAIESSLKLQLYKLVLSQNGSEQPRTLICSSLRNRTIMDLHCKVIRTVHVAQQWLHQWILQIA